MLSRAAIAGLLLLNGTGSVLAADAEAGKAYFRAQCALCHSAEPGDDGGAQGPDLNGVYGRAAASGDFAFTLALKDSGLRWDAETLDRFLASPTTVVAGSAMVIAVPQAEDRANLVAYFEAVGAGRRFEDPTRRPRRSSPPPEALPQEAADWRQDAPGRVHRIDVASLPPPFDTPSVRNLPRLVPPPAGVAPQVPEGFGVELFAEGLSGPRTMLVAPNGDVFLAETRSGRIKVLRPDADGRRAATIETYAQGLMLPFGMQFYPAGPKPEWLYVAETDRVVRYPYRAGQVHAGGLPEVVVPQLSPVGGGHYTRGLAFSPDGRRLFVSVGSQSNVAEDMPKKTPQEIEAWEAQHGLGAAWGEEENRAAVLVFELGSDRPGRIFATGIRNCVGLTVQPETGELWCTTNERDRLGDNLVPDYSTRVQEGGFYGWPWYYMGTYEDPRLKGDRPDLRGKAIVPDVPYQAHSAALTLTFYTASQGASAFPKEYLGDGFAALHGSWNRAFRTGHKIVRVRIEDGVPTGEYEDFMVGFITESGDAWARPVGVAVAQDGSLLVSDDGGDRIYRIFTRPEGDQ